MKQHYKWLLAGFSMVAVLTTVAGCATTPSANQNSTKTANLTQTSTSNSTNSTSSGPNTSQNATSSTPSMQKNTSPTTPSNVIVHSYASVSQATNAIDAIQQGFGQIYPSGPNLNLGNGISAEQDGALGSLYLKWTEGRWTILAQLASSGAVTQAKQMVSYLHTHMLPVPQNKGVIRVIQSLNSTLYTRTIVAWQVGTKVYEIQQTGDPVSALRIAVNSSVG